MGSLKKKLLTGLCILSLISVFLPYAVRYETDYFGGSGNLWITQIKEYTSIPQIITAVIMSLIAVILVVAMILIIRGKCRNTIPTLLFTSVIIFDFIIMLINTNIPECNRYSVLYPGAGWTINILACTAGIIALKDSSKNSIWSVKVGILVINMASIAAPIVYGAYPLGNDENTYFGYLSIGSVLSRYLLIAIALLTIISFILVIFDKKIVSIISCAALAVVEFLPILFYSEPRLDKYLSSHVIELTPAIPVAIAALIAAIIIIILELAGSRIGSKIKERPVIAVCIANLAALLFPYIASLDGYDSGNSLENIFPILMKHYLNDYLANNSIDLIVTAWIMAAIAVIGAAALIIAIKGCSDKLITGLLLAVMFANMAIMAIGTDTPDCGDYSTLMPSAGWILSMISCGIGITMLKKTEHRLLWSFKVGFALLNMIAIVMPVFYRMYSNVNSFRGYESLGNLGFIMQGYEHTQNYFIYVYIATAVLAWTIVNFAVLLTDRKISLIISSVILIFMDIIPIYNSFGLGECEYLRPDIAGITPAVPVAIASLIGLIIVTVIEINSFKSKKIS